MLYMHIDMFIIYICYHVLKFDMRENQILQTLTSRNLPSFIPAKIEKFLIRKINTC